MAKSRLRQRASSGPANALFPAWIASLQPHLSAWRVWLPQSLLIAVITLWIYAPSMHGEFVSDDGWYITTNPLLTDPDGLWKFWFQPGSWVEYYPIQETVLWLQWQLFGTNTLGYHLTNVVLHIANALLLWRLLAKLGVRLAWVGGLLFAVHPVNVESVAWISELKNTLSLPFFLLAMCSWIDYDDRRRKEDYQWALFLFVIGMLCKISMAPLPVILLLYAWWKRLRIGWDDVRATLPFFVVSLVLGFATIRAGQIYERVGQAQDLIIPLGSFPVMFARAGMILGYYFAHCFVPVDLMPGYPKWPTDAGSVGAYVPWIVLAAGLGWAWKERRRWGRHVLLGVGFFGLTIGPFIGFHVVSYMIASWVELHLLYIPVIGLIGLFVAGLGDGISKLPNGLRFSPMALVAIAVGWMAIATYNYAGWFTDENTLWTRALQKDPTSWLAYHNLGCDLLAQKHYDEAAARLRQALVLAPDFSDGYYNLGVAYDRLGKEDDAEINYRKSIELNPTALKAYLNIGEMRRREGNLPAAEKEYRAGLAVSPGDPSLSIDLGNVLLQTGRVPEALDLLRTSLAKYPRTSQLEYNLGTVMLRLGDTAGATEHLENAAALDPSLVGAHSSLGVIYAQTGRLAEAIEQFQAALALDANARNVHDNLAIALAQSGRLPEAMEQVQLALQANPNDARAKDLQAKLQQTGLPPGATAPH